MKVHIILYTDYFPYFLFTSSGGAFFARSLARPLSRSLLRNPFFYFPSVLLINAGLLSYTACILIKPAHKIHLPTLPPKKKVERIRKYGGQIFFATCTRTTLFVHFFFPHPHPAAAAAAAAAAPHYYSRV
jgi:hypothetical protein